MKKNLLRLSRPLFLVALLSFTFLACNNENDINSADVQEYVDEVVFRMEESGNVGRFGCYELVFPITISYPDGSTGEVADYDALRAAIADWKEANPEANERPEFAFPVEVLSEDGEVISVANKEELRELKRACRRDFFNRRGHKGHSGRCGSCFTIVFPVSVSFPDGSTAEAADRMALKDLVRDWKANNPDSTERPELVFPVTVEFEDETTTEVNSIEELKALRESCNTEG